MGRTRGPEVDDDGSSLVSRLSNVLAFASMILAMRASCMGGLAASNATRVGLIEVVIPKSVLALHRAVECSYNM